MEALTKAQKELGIDTLNGLQIGHISGTGHRRKRDHILENRHLEAGQPTPTNRRIRLRITGYVRSQ